MNRSRKNIGLLVGNIMDAFSNLICQGVMKAAEEQDVNLIIFPGNYLDFNRNEDVGLSFEYQPNTLFSYANAEGIDMILACISSVGCLATEEHKRELIDSVQGIPMLTIASKERGCASITYDNRKGFKEGIEYIICEKKKRKLAMLSGPVGNSDFMERWEVFRDTLTEHGIEVKEKMFAYGDASRFSTKAAEELLDRNPDAEAIICGNDDMAFAVYDVCMRRGIEIGKDLLVLGFDDVEASRKLSPPLASVHADAATLGYRALLQGISILEGEAEDTLVLPTRFIPRESVSYQGEDIRTIIHSAFSGRAEEAQREHIANVIVSYVFYADTYDKKAAGFQSLILDILRMFAEAEDCDESKSEALMAQIRANFGKLMHGGISGYTDQHRMVQLYTVAMHELQSARRGGNYCRVLASVLAEQMQFVMDSMIYRASEKNKRSMSLLHSTNILSRDMLMTEEMGEQSYLTVISKMHMLDIERSCLLVFEQPKQHRFQDVWRRPEEILLKAYQVDASATAIPRTKQKVMTSKIFMQPFFHTKERHTWVLNDLYSGEWQYGIFICDLQYELFYLTELLTYQISSAVKMLNLFLKEQETHDRLEETLEQLTLNNITLDRISRFDELTGILNRRGFMERGAELLQNAEGKTILVVYADLDSLKTINDLFGHDEGDFALRAATEILSIAFYKKGVIGRLGGDEFAGLIVCEEPNEKELLYQKVKKCMNDYNADIKKPYRVQLSIGMDEIYYSPDMRLSDMLSQADDLLYQEKRNKKDILVIEKSENISQDEVEQMVRQLEMSEEGE